MPMLSHAAVDNDAAGAEHEAQQQQRQHHDAKAQVQPQVIDCRDDHHRAGRRKRQPSAPHAGRESSASRLTTISGMPIKCVAILRASR